MRHVLGSIPVSSCLRLCWDIDLIGAPQDSSPTSARESVYTDLGHGRLSKQRMATRHGQRAEVELDKAVEVAWAVLKVGMYVYLHACMHAGMYTYVYPYTYTHMHINTYMYMYMYIYIYMYMYTVYTYISLLLLLFYTHT